MQASLRDLRAPKRRGRLGIILGLFGIVLAGLIFTYIISNKDVGVTYTKYQTPEQVIDFAKPGDYIEFRTVLFTDKQGRFVWQNFENGPAVVFTGNSKIDPVGIFRVQLTEIKGQQAQARFIEEK